MADIGLAGNFVRTSEPVLRFTNSRPLKPYRLKLHVHGLGKARAKQNKYSPYFATKDEAMQYMPEFRRLHEGPVDGKRPGRKRKLDTATDVSAKEPGTWHDSRLPQSALKAFKQAKRRFKGGSQRAAGSDGHPVTAVFTQADWKCSAEGRAFMVAMTAKATARAEYVLLRAVRSRAEFEELHAETPDWALVRKRIARLEVRKLALQGRITGDTQLVNKLKHAVDSRDYCSVLLFASAVLMPVTPATALAPPAQAAASVHGPASTLSPDGEPPLSSTSMNGPGAVRLSHRHAAPEGPASGGSGASVPPQPRNPADNHPISGRLCDLEVPQGLRIYVQATMVLALLKRVVEADLICLKLIADTLSNIEALQPAAAPSWASLCQGRHLTHEAYYLLLECRKQVDKVCKHNELPVIAEAVVQFHHDVGRTTLLDWHREFRRLDGRFREDQRGKHARDWILSEEDLQIALRNWVKANQHKLSVERVYKYVNEQLLAGDEHNIYFSKHNIKRPISMSTIHAWMGRLGCTYEHHHKTYYTDGHNRPDVVADRVAYTKLVDVLSLRMPLWIQLPSAIVPKTVPKEERYEYMSLDMETEDGIRFQHQFTEFHVDWLGVDGDKDLFVEFRNKPENLHGGARSVRFPAVGESKCLHNHARFDQAGLPSVCRCHQPIIEVGQDETTFNVHNYNNMGWVIDGEHELRSKSNGIGVMISAFQSEVFGLGLHLTAEKLQEYNAHRHSNGLAPLVASPGLRSFEYGVNREGYWTYTTFAEQVTDVMLLCEWLYPGYQLALKVDHSAGHAKLKDDGLNVGNMNVNWGGKQQHLHDSKVTAAGLGSGEALQTVTVDGQKLVVDCKVKDGQMQSFNFKASDPPPHFDLGVEKEDRTNPNQPVKTVVPRKSKKNTAPQPREEPNIIPGYVGKAKGMKQILWERGLWKEGMTANHDVLELNMNIVLSRCPDFVEETSAMQDLVERRGHILIMSPKFSPEVAGVGVEFTFARSKTMFRREHNDHVPAHLLENVLKSMSPEVITLDLVRKFARRARDYMRAYAAPDAPSSHVFIERMTKKIKTHRSILDLDSGFVQEPGPAGALP